MFNEKTRKDQLDFLTKIKSILQLDEHGSCCQSFQPPQNIGNKVDLESKIDELARRIEDLENRINSEKSESIRKARVKDQILSVLQQHKRLSSAQLSSIINLSRTRCNEYLKELSTEGLTEGVIVGRQKFYKLVK